MVCQPGTRRRVTQVQQPAVFAAEYPFRMLFRQPGSRRKPASGSNHTMVLMPCECAWSEIARSPWGNRFSVHLPSAGIGPAGLVHIPAGIHPPMANLDSLLEEALGPIRSDSVRWPASSRHDSASCSQTALVPGAGRPGLGTLYARAFPPAPNVLRPNPLPLPELEHHERRAHLLPGMQL